MSLTWNAMCSAKQTLHACVYYALNNLQMPPSSSQAPASGDTLDQQNAVVEQTSLPTAHALPKCLRRGLCHSVGPMPPCFKQVAAAAIQTLPQRSVVPAAPGASAANLCGSAGSHAFCANSRSSGHKPRGAAWVKACTPRPRRRLSKPTVGGAATILLCVDTAVVLSVTSLSLTSP